MLRKRGPYLIDLMVITLVVNNVQFNNREQIHEVLEWTVDAWPDTVI